MSLYAAMLRTVPLRVSLWREHAMLSLTHWRLFEESQYWSYAQLQEYQWEKLQLVLRQAYDHSKYYRRVMDERGLTPKSFSGLDDLRKLPILTRPLLDKHMPEMIADNYSESALTRFDTGGTTSRRVVLYRDQESSNIKRAAAWRFEGWMGRKPCDKTCFFWPPHMDVHDHESWKLRLRKRYIDRERMYYTGAATDEQFVAFYHDLMSFEPEYFKVFPSGLHRFSQVIQEHGLRPPKIKGIMSTGEILYSAQRRLFEELYQCQVYDMYGSREVGNTSSQCGHDEGRHIAMETQIVEFIADERPVAAGEEGELVITDLTNSGFPLIRYAINDFATYETTRCACGRELPLMSAGIGRVGDTFVTRDGRRHSPLAMEYNILRTGPPIGQCQIIQRRLTDFLVRLVPDPEPTPQVLDHIRQAIRHLTGGDTEVEIELVDEIPKERSGKIRLLKCEVSDTELPHANPGA